MARAKGQIDLNKHRAILAAAAEVIHYPPTPEPVFRMSAVARRAGVSKQTLYNHFGSREQLMALLPSPATARAHLPEAAEILLHGLAPEDAGRLAARLNADTPLAEEASAEVLATAWILGATAMANAARGRRICRICGCHESHACEGGCSWAEPDLCSACDLAPASAEAYAVDDFGGLYATEHWKRDDQATSDRLLMCDVHITAATLAALTKDQVQAADLWAISAYADASDNDVLVPPRPDFLPTSRGINPAATHVLER